LVANDTKNKNEDAFRETALSFDVIKNMLNSSKAKQIFAMVDVCRGGHFDPEQPRMAMRGKKDYQEVLQIKEALESQEMNKRERVFISSGSDELVPDREEGSMNSPFINHFVKGIESIQNKMKLLTLDDLFEMVDGKLTTTPRKGSFDKGQKNKSQVFPLLFLKDGW
jgi:hypothetical protein